MERLLVLVVLVLLNTSHGLAMNNSLCTVLSALAGMPDICTLNTPLGKCVGNVDNGDLCQCPESRAGPLCYLQVVGAKKNLSLCERQQELHTTTVRVLNTTDNNTDKSIVQFRAFIDLDALKSAMHAMNLSYLHERTCLPDGMFTPPQCDVSIDDLATRRCYCVESGTGDVVHEVTATAFANVNCDGEGQGSNPYNVKYLLMQFLNLEV
ncbi:uncharacterized protein [Haliotis cracherodii]|uniref:uncharacterized protein isoform X1 n=1 Tax=Haliotis cracherodii TaxID=6455 RepID=UPI0039E7EC7B